MKDRDYEPTGYHAPGEVPFTYLTPRKPEPPQPRGLTLKALVVLIVLVSGFAVGTVMRGCFYPGL